MFLEASEGEGLFLCPGHSARPHRPAFAPAAEVQGWQFWGAGCSQLRGKLEKGGPGAFRISSLGDAAVLRVSAFGKKSLGLKEPGIASSIRRGIALLK